MLSSKVRLIQHLVDARNYKAYLEIGVAGGRVFNAVRIPHKTGVDPKARVKHQNIHSTTSDEFFQTNKEMFDIVFIDGLHLHQQVLRDVNNALLCLNEGGCLILHDVLPKRESMQLRKKPAKGPWTGDVWKAWFHLRMTRPDLYMRCIQDDRVGLGLVERKEQRTIKLLKPAGELSYAFYEANKHLMNIVTLDSICQ